MSYALQRRLPLGPLDRQVARAGMQICHRIVMQQLYISRADAAKQWVVVSNPSEECVDLTGFRLSCSGTRDVFRFPTRYTLLPGDEVTVWCAPGGLKLDEDNLLQPYLFWTKADGSLRHEPFFSSKASANEVLLLDPLMVEVASLRVAADGRKEFRVLHCKSGHSRTVRSEIDTRFCVGCLSPPEFETRTSRPSPESGKITSPAPNEREVYVFSRYWGVVSDKSLFEHFLAVFLVPLIESFRAVLIYIMMCTFQPVSKSGLGPQLRTKVTTLLLMMLACDVVSRRLMLFIKSGLLVTIASFTSVVLDRVAVVVLYLSLQRLYPALGSSFQYMLTFDLGIGCVNAAAVHVRFLEARRDWHPLFKQFARWGHRSRGIICACGIGRELLLHLLLLLPFSDHPSPVWKAVGYLLVPLFTVASGVDFLRAVATILHMVRYPIKEAPPVVFSTPKTLRFRSLRPYS
ncbi:hypothetical protein PHYSODRAFT_503320 [Phytophthora sojae]|uniref:LTD domain-containing protein n=1 Tax=Phytophthora sojae (strain P6497) TaxID=1094619 RepID=G4ZH95_PHYSP|nr:hypothetical protein PHYSODRAFT_503320 [Phytophthora sojae]EGZ17144.1 hypothetical protein PHYSODRAFT_503320 [Phytophthora sojae]|eukprot:XP_009526202.1 hypothetical protein PHYSODRAFT_503320 [Phytophthora sojae]